MTLAELKDLLRQAGLNEPEARTYLTLLELGPSTTGPLVKQTGIPSSKIYGLLYGLVTKGLATYAVTAGRKQFEAAPPQAIHRVLEERAEELGRVRQRLDAALPELLERRKAPGKRYSVTVYEGVRGIKSLNEAMLRQLKAGETAYMVGAPKLRNPSLRGFFIDYHARRAKRGIQLYTVKNAEGRKHRLIEDYPHTRVKYLPLGMNMPTMFQLFRDTVAIVVYDPFPIAFVIESPAIAKSFRGYFTIIWKLAED